MSKEDLLEKHKIGFAFLRKKNYADAATVFSEIVAICPDWEHGSAAYALACSSEELGQFECAERNYQLALKCEPGNTHYLSGYASFLLFHAAPERAFDFFLSQLVANDCRPDFVQEQLPELAILSQRLGVPTDELVNRMLDASKAHASGQA